MAKINLGKVTKTLDELGGAPKNHAGTAATYGAGTATNYGHVKLSDDMTKVLTAEDGYAATPASVAALNKEIGVCKESITNQLGNVRIEQGSIVVTVTASNSFVLFSNITKYGSFPTILASNGSGSNQSARVLGCTIQNNACYVNLDRSATAGPFRINYAIIYTPD